jgi:hypothetical protein
MLSVIMLNVTKKHLVLSVVTPLVPSYKLKNDPIKNYCTSLIGRVNIPLVGLKSVTKFGHV